MRHAAFNLKGNMTGCSISDTARSVYRCITNCASMHSIRKFHSRGAVQQNQDFKLVSYFQYSQEPTEISHYSCFFGGFWFFSILCTQTHLNWGKVPREYLCSSSCVNPEQGSLWLLILPRHANMLRGLMLGSCRSWKPEVINRWEGSSHLCMG